MAYSNPLEYLVSMDWLDTFLPDFVLAFTFFTALTYAVLGRRVGMQRPAVAVSAALGERGIKAGVIDLYRIKPVNGELLLNSLKGIRRVATLEEHLLAGGLGSVVLEVLADNDNTVPVKRLGIQDEYMYAYGGRNNIRELCGLDRDSVAATISEWLEKND